MLKLNQKMWVNHTEKPTALTFTVNELLSLRPTGNRLSAWGTNHLLLYLQILRDLQKKTLKPEQVITFSRGAMVEQKAARSTGGIEGEERLLVDVLNQAVSLNAPDCIRALCQLYGGEKETRKVLNRLAIQLNVSKKSQRSLTGRLADTQKSNLFDYYKIGLEFLKLNESTLSFLKNKSHVIKDKIFEPQPLANLQTDVVASISWGNKSNQCLLFYRINQKIVCSLVINAKDSKHVTELVSALSLLTKEGELNTITPLHSMNVEDDNNVDIGLEWLDINLKGQILNKDLRPDFNFDMISLTPRKIKEGNYTRSLFISLSPEDIKDMRGAKAKESIHRNEALLKRNISDKLALIITDEPIEAYRNKVPQYIVGNSLEAASLIADIVAESYSGKMITITGSAGKSSTRMILENLLSEMSLVSNQGNNNVHLPNLELALNLVKKPQYLIAEVALGGLNRRAYGNESYRYCSDVVIITSYGLTHTKTGSEERNLDIKNELFRHTKNGATAVINGDIEKKYLCKIMEEANRQNLQIKTYSLSNNQSYCYLVGKEVKREGADITISLNQQIYSFPIAVDSDGQIQNIMASLIALEALGCDVSKHIPFLKEHYNLPRNLERILVGDAERQFTLLDDSHNNSLLAMRNGIMAFSEKRHLYSGNGLLILGEISDLEHDGISEHTELKKVIIKSGAEHVFLYGAAFKQLSDQLPNAQWFLDKEKIFEEVTNYLTNDSLVYIKGSGASYSSFYTVADQLKQYVL
ncbi:Mur ligase family protein [Ignatzschineria sp. LJL83]